ncbi:MAG: isocitrate/isopropylmalate family dehydrogenase, partial [Chloroflexota bacterium]|nr:isocitrate/isopropylmalate family dehydrogenase [Chloroflexota bacterium]
HGTALYTPEVVGSGRANPIAAVLSAALMLRYSFDMEEAAGTVEAAVQAVLDEGYRTPDIATEPASSREAGAQDGAARSGTLHGGPAHGGPAHGERIVTTSQIGRLIAERIGQVRLK